MEPLRHLLHVHDRGHGSYRDIVGIAETRTGDVRVREAEQCHGHPGPGRVKQRLLDHHFGPRIPEQAEGKGACHSRDVRLHVVRDAAAGILVREAAEVLG
ncbi:MAG: hypothetical protein OXL34_16695, partial [Gemmatimonadota bacterium]|nr:hypothetical protein [Gemmatimonadota bacterium]